MAFLLLAKSLIKLICLDMRIGIIGLGTVGGTLLRWFRKNTSHQISCFDPAKNLNDDLRFTDAIFICVPVPPADNGQDLSIVIQSVNLAKRYTENVFIKSTVLPGTNDALKCVSCPEFLTARRPDEDMEKYPILVGEAHVAYVELIFPKKKIISMKNTEAEMAKLAHNCFGAMKVTYFNMINSICQLTGAEYNKVLEGAMITGFIESEHTSVPGHDGRLGYGGTCFPANVESMKQFMHFVGMSKEHDFFKIIQNMNRSYRIDSTPFLSSETNEGIDA